MSQYFMQSILVKIILEVNLKNKKSIKAKFDFSNKTIIIIMHCISQQKNDVR